MINKFETQEENGKLHVCVEVPHSDRVIGIPRIRIDTKDVIAILEERKINYGECIQESILKNWREHNRKKEWIFKTSIDKVEKQVTLKEEKSVQPKPVRKKRTRSSTKKVSTEE